MEPLGAWRDNWTELRQEKHPHIWKKSPENVELFVDAVLRKGSFTEACKVVGINPMTGWKWCQDPAIRVRVEAALEAHKIMISVQGPLGPIPWPARTPQRGRKGKAGKGGDSAWEGLGNVRAKDKVLLPSKRPAIEIAAIGEARRGPGKEWEGEAVPSLPLAAYASDPGGFMTDVLGWTPWSKQIEVAEALREALLSRSSLPNNVIPFRSASSAHSAVKSHPRFIAVRSGNGVGKTAIAARLMLWVVACFRDSVVITTAPTTRQVDELLWREASKAYHGAKAPLGGTFYDRQSRWEMDDKHYALGLSPEQTNPEKFQGFHARTLVFILDEASAIPHAHWEAISGSALAGNTVLLAIGNPLRLNGVFYDAFHSKSRSWRRIGISAFDTPNLKGTTEYTESTEKKEAVDVGGESLSVVTSLPFPELVTPEAVEQARLDWGEGSNQWRIRILGQFPTATSTSLIDLEWFAGAHSASFSAAGARLPAFALGVDVARAGADETALVLMYGNTLCRIETFRGQDTMRTAARVREYWDSINRHGSLPAGFGESLFEPEAEARIPDFHIAVDDGGVGGGVVDRVRELGITVHPVIFGAAADGRMKELFRNKLSELYWVVREELMAGKIRIPGPAAT